MTVSSSRVAPRWQKYGPWAVVTGASDGIGRALAVQLAGKGLNLVLVARREARLRELAHELEAGQGVETRVVAADLAQPDDVKAVLDAAADLDVGLLVASAGFGTSGPLIEADLDDELEMVDVNCRALLQMTAEFGRRFARRGRGGIVLLSSLVAFQGVPRSANYAATKAYVQSLSEGLALELKPSGVDVIASAPGPVESGFAARANMNLGSALAPEVVAQETLQALGRKSLVKPGFMTKFLLFSLALLPRALRVRVVGMVMRGMTKHQLTRATA